MKSEEKIYKVLKIIKEKTEIAPLGAVLEYRAGRELGFFGVEDEILILNKFADEGVIEVVGNFGSESI
jgi:hypothetical protein